MPIIPILIVLLLVSLILLLLFKLLPFLIGMLALVGAWWIYQRLRGPGPPTHRPRF